MPRILIVEDSATQAEELRLILESRGFAAEVAFDAPAALERLGCTSFDLVLSDVVMPTMSGYELCRRLKTDPATKHLPVVLLTQLNNTLDILTGLECGADNFITKPFDANYLVRRLQGILAYATGTRSEGAMLSFRGTGITITTNKEQILDLLLATVEDFVHTRAREREMTASRDMFQREAADLAESARRKDHFLSMLAHELRTPLAPILTNLHLARQPGTGSAAMERALATAERQARHLKRLVDELLDASRLTRGNVQLHLERLDLARLARTAAEDRRLLLEEAGLVLTVDVPETPVWLRGDPTRLAQVLNNLLDNAAKYTERGRVAVRLVVEKRTAQARLTVTDTGVGIAPDILRQLGELFVQADVSLDRPRGGLGLGLAVVKGIVELHGGIVQAASAGQRQGAEFTILLTTEREPPALSAPAAPAPPMQSKLRILVVEDSRDAADSLKMLLELMGHETRVAYTGPDGVTAAKEWRPDLVLCDIGLPGLDGYGVARALRLDPATSAVRLLAVTGYSSEEDRLLTRQAGFDEHLTKPVAPETLGEFLFRC